MRFSPPRVSVPTELSWLLGAAFGADSPPAVIGEPAVVSELAGRFCLGPRIVARQSASVVEDRLGAAAGELIHSYRRSVAVSMAAEHTARRLTELAASSGLELVFLKGYALQLLAPAPAGRRPFVDLDALLSRPAAEELHDLLVSTGWTGAGEAGNPQHLPPITSPQGTPVDLHFRLRGIRVAGARWATAGELLEAGLCRPADPAGSAWLPSPPVLAAHLAVHAIEQHGHRPTTYPLLRAIGDIADLIAADAGEQLAVEAGRFVSESLTEVELEAVFTLARVLTEGRPPDPERGEEKGADRLLRHIVAGTLDRAYRQSLALDHTAGRLREAHRDGELMRYIARKLKGPGESPEAGSRGSASRSGSVRRRLSHPIQLCARFATAAAARLRRAFH